MKITLVNTKDANGNSLTIDTQATKDTNTLETIDFNLPRYTLSRTEETTVNSSDKTVAKRYTELDQEKGGSFFTGNSDNVVNYYHEDETTVGSVTDITDSSKLPKNTFINSNVGKQDENPNDYDLLTADGWKSLGETYKKQSLNSLGSLVGVNENNINNLKNLFGSDTDNVKTNTLLLDQWKNDHYKEFHTTDWTNVQTLNPTTNAANSAASDLRGELGKSTGSLSSLTNTNNSWAKAGLQLTDTLLGTSNINSLANTVGSYATSADIGDSNWQADADELAVLNSVTKDTMYTSKPGIRFKAKNDMVQNIASNDASAAIFGTSRYANKKDVKETVYGADFEQLRENQISTTRLSNIRTAVLNANNNFTKKRQTYNLKETKKALGDLYTLNENTGGGYSWEKETDYGLSDEEAQLITLLKNKNTYNKSLGYLYIRPYYNYNCNKETDNGFGVFDIPFEFNPTVSEGSMQANYQQETLLGRLGQFQVFTGTNLSTVNVELTYYALAPDTLSQEDQDKMGKQYGTDAWQYYWNNSMLEAIELKLRSLVLADYVSDSYLIKPPLVEIHLENNNGDNYDSVGDLYKYPGSVSWENDKATLSNKVNANYLATSSTLHSEQAGACNRYKKYIVNSVQIDKISDADILYPSLYGRKYNNNYNTAIQQNPRFHITTGTKGYAGYSRKKGFKATLQLTEVTENFLDLVPDFKAYYDAWNYKQLYGSSVSKYADLSMGANEQNTYMSVTDVLSSSAATLNNSLLSTTDQIDLLFDEAEKLAGLYAKSKTTKDNKTPGLKNIEYLIGQFNYAYDYNGNNSEKTTRAKELKDAKNPFYFINQEKQEG